MPKVICVIGTRPEAIKMAPVILELRSRPAFTTVVLATAQHREMLDQVLQFFGVTPDHDLNLMKPNQNLTELTARVLLGVGQVCDSERPDALLVQGDTTTVLGASLAAFYKGVPVGHVEAGLRTGDMRNPFPEEANRVLTSQLAHWHFAPTASARDNLLHESFAGGAIEVTGNTVIDALLSTAARSDEIGLKLPKHDRLILVTCHRRENFGAPVERVCAAIRRLALANPTICFLFPVHPNPNVKAVAERTLQGIDNIVLCPPLEYAPFVAAMKASYFIISDSGGVQEEAPALGKPALVLREESERPEAIAEGVVELVGTLEENIVSRAQQLLNDDKKYQSMSRGVSPYGDGNAAKRIVNRLEKDLC